MSVAASLFVISATVIVIFLFVFKPSEPSSDKKSAWTSTSALNSSSLSYHSLFSSAPSASAITNVKDLLFTTKTSEKEIKPSRKQKNKESKRWYQWSYNTSLISWHAFFRLLLRCPLLGRALPPCWAWLPWKGRFVWRSLEIGWHLGSKIAWLYGSKSLLLGFYDWVLLRKPRYLRCWSFFGRVD